MMNQDIYKLPNIVSLIRIFMAPILLLLAIYQQAGVFLAVLLFAVFTDVLDGFLARSLNQITELGSHLDSWGDFAIYSVMAISAWLLWPDTVVKEQVYFIIILLSFTFPVLIGLIKFRTLTSYHTWSVKLAVAVTVIGYICLFSGVYEGVFRLAAMFCVYAAVEEVSISLLLKREHVDVKTLMHALQLNKIDQKES